MTRAPFHGTLTASCFHKFDLFELSRLAFLCKKLVRCYNIGSLDSVNVAHISNESHCFRSSMSEVLLQNEVAKQQSPMRDTISH